MTDFITQMFYDQGHYDAVENTEPLFSKPIWRKLIHRTKSADDRTRILNAKAFNAAGNANIIAGIYTIPDVWMDAEDMPAPDVAINFVTRDCRFAHNGANRPLDAYKGIASCWWNHLWCAAAGDIGFDVKPAHRSCDFDWLEQNRDVVETCFKEKRVPFMRALNEKLAEAEIDVLGNAGEFIILNQAVVDWDLTRTSSGFETAYRRRANAIKAKLNSAFEDFRALILKLRMADQLAMAQFKPLANKTIVVSGILMKNDTRPLFLDRAAEIAERHGFKLALTADPWESGDMSKTPADYGFAHQQGNYFFQ